MKESDKFSLVRKVAESIGDVVCRIIAHPGLTAGALSMSDGPPEMLRARADAANERDAKKAKREN